MEYKDYLSIYKVYKRNPDNYVYYYASVDCSQESEEDTKAKKMAKERERKIDLILS
jgi:hypothetical protein